MKRERDRTAEMITAGTGLRADYLAGEIRFAQKQAMERLLERIGIGRTVEWRWAVPGSRTDSFTLDELLDEEGEA